MAGVLFSLLYSFKLGTLNFVIHRLFVGFLTAGLPNLQKMSYLF